MEQISKTMAKEKKEKDYFAEARRYVANAKEDAQKAGKDGNYYTDKKYIRRAGHTLWTGVLIALEPITNIKATKSNRLKYQDYLNAVAKIDRKKPAELETAYETLHLAMGYDGTLRYKTVQDGFEQANYMIDWAEKIYKQRNKQ